MDNVVNLNEFKGENSRPNRPNDLLKIKEFKVKYGLSYEYLYKWAVIKKQIRVYSKGGLALSEREVLEFEEKRAMRYGWNK